MIRVITQEEDERQLLSQYCRQNNGSFVVSQTQVQPIIEMVRSIAYQYFETDLPLIACKVRQLCLDTLNMTFSLSLFRQTMALLKKHTEFLTFHQENLTNINREFSTSTILSPITNNLSKINKQNIESAFNKNSPFDKIAQTQLPLESKLQLKRDSKTQKSIHSQTIEEANNKSSVKSISKFSQFLKASNLSLPKEGKGRGKNDSSVQLQEFQKTGNDLMQNKIEVLIREQIIEDIKKDFKSVRKQLKNAQIQYYRYNRQIKDSLMTSKLKTRRRK